MNSERSICKYIRTRVRAYVSVHVQVLAANHSRARARERESDGPPDQYFTLHHVVFRPNAIQTLTAERQPYKTRCRSLFPYGYVNMNIRRSEFSHSRGSCTVAPLHILAHPSSRHACTYTTHSPAGWLARVPFPYVHCRAPNGAHEAPEAVIFIDIWW